MVAALAIIDESGVEALTMRRLGQALDRNPMAVYRHARDKDAVLDGVLELVILELDRPGALRDPAPDGPGRDWEQTLVEVAHAVRLVALAHPNLVPLLATRLLSRPLCRWPLGLLRPLEQLLQVFVGAGFDTRGAWHASRVFTGSLLGHVVQESQQQVDNPDETDDVLRFGLHRLPVTEFPRLRALAPVLATYDGAAELDEELTIVLAGLRSQLGNPHAD